MLSRTLQTNKEFIPKPGFKISPFNNMGNLFIQNFDVSEVAILFLKTLNLNILLTLIYSKEYYVIHKNLQHLGKPSLNFTASLLNWTYVST